MVKLEVPLLCMVAVPGEKYGEVLGLGTDGAVHRVVLPSEGQAWAGLKGRMHKSATRAMVHGRAEGSIALTYSRQLVVTGSQVSARLNSLSATIWRPSPGAKLAASQRRDARGV